MVILNPLGGDFLYLHNPEIRGIVRLSLTIHKRCEMPKEMLHLYDAGNTKWSPKGGFRSGAILTVPLSLFTRTSGCTEGAGRSYLNERNIGKRFKLSILDPVKIGEVEFLGIVTKQKNCCIPAFIYKKMKEEEFFLRLGNEFESFFAFKQDEEYIEEYIVVNTDYCDVVPLF